MFKCISAIPFETFFQLDNNNRTRDHSAKIKKNKCRTENTSSQSELSTDGTASTNIRSKQMTSSPSNDTWKKRNTRMDLFMD